MVSVTVVILLTEKPVPVKYAQEYYSSIKVDTKCYNLDINWVEASHTIWSWLKLGLQPRGIFPPRSANSDTSMDEGQNTELEYRITILATCNLSTEYVSCLCFWTHGLDIAYKQSNLPSSYDTSSVQPLAQNLSGANLRSADETPEVDDSWQ